MKQILKIFMAVVITATFLFGIVACTNNGENTSTIILLNNEDVKGNIKFTTLGTDSGESPAVISFVEEFNKKYPNVKVELDILPLGILQSTKDARISSGEIGDVFWIFEEDVYTYSITQQACLELDFYLNQFNVDVSNVYSGMFNIGKVNGKLYMVARDNTHISLSYNKDALKNEGLDEPKEDWTWNDFKDYCKTLTKTEDGGLSYTQVGAFLNVGYQPIWMAFAQGWGGTLYDTVNKKINLISDPKVYEGLNEMYTLMEKGYIKQLGAPATKYPNFVEGVNSVFKDIVYPEVDSFGKIMEQNGTDWDLVSMPTLPKHTVGAGATGHVVYKESRNKLAAAALCTFFFTNEGQLSYNSGLGGSVPLVKSLADEGFWKTPYTEKNYDVFVSYPEADIIGKLACVVPKSVADILNYPNMSKILTDALSGEKSLADGLTAAEALANEKWTSISRN